MTLRSRRLSHLFLFFPLALTWASLYLHFNFRNIGIPTIKNTVNYSLHVGRQTFKSKGKHLKILGVFWSCKCFLAKPILRQQHGGHLENLQTERQMQGVGGSHIVWLLSSLHFQKKKELSAFSMSASLAFTVTLWATVLVGLWSLVGSWPTESCPLQ